MLPVSPSITAYVGELPARASRRSRRGRIRFAVEVSTCALRAGIASLVISTLPGRRALALAVGAELHLDPLLAQVGRDARVVEVPPLLVRRGDRPARPLVDDLARHEGEEARVLPDVGLGVPVVLPPDAAIADDQGRGVADLAR